MYSFLHPVSLLAVSFPFHFIPVPLLLHIALALNIEYVGCHSESRDSIYLTERRGVDCRALKLDGAALIFLHCIYFCPLRPHFSNNVMFLQTQQAFRASNETCRSCCFCLKFHFCLNVDRIKLCGSSEWDKVLHMWPRKPKQWAGIC